MPVVYSYLCFLSLYLEAIKFVRVKEKISSELNMEPSCIYTIATISKLTMDTWHFMMLIISNHFVCIRFEL